jgi:hypothetical protein
MYNHLPESSSLPHHHHQLPQDTRRKGLGIIPSETVLLLVKGKVKREKPTSCQVTMMTTMLMLVTNYSNSLVRLKEQNGRERRRIMLRLFELKDLQLRSNPTARSLLLSENSVHSFTLTLQSHHLLLQESCFQMIRLVLSRQVQVIQNPIFTPKIFPQVGIRSVQEIVFHQPEVSLEVQSNFTTIKSRVLTNTNLKNL